MRTTQRMCPVCGTGQVDWLHTQRFELPAGHPLTGGYDVVHCIACGFVYADSAVSQADYDRFYAQYSKYEDGKTGTGGGENPFDRVRLEETARQIADFLQDPTVRILDVGCANGGLLRALNDLGYENLCGLDPSPVCVENTRALGLEAYLGSLFQPFPHGKFDCVVLSHTLEHVQDVRGAIAWIGDMLDPGGANLAYIETPDAARYVDFLYAPFQDFNTEHINHFSKISLENALELAGFETLASGEKTLTINPTMFYPAVYGFWKKLAARPIASFRPDTHLAAQMDAYIRESRTILDGIEKRLQAVLAQSPRVIVWGVGQLALKLLVETSLGKAEIAAFVDSNPINHGKVLHGVKIFVPEAIHIMHEPIVITSTLHQASIAKQIRGMGLENKLIFLKE
ncbi:MAG TPA: methyltransferase type 11 [Chloroflexi bacterium]|nr:methyltransferase type 11 [Chloroflexota bacterium]